MHKDDEKKDETAEAPVPPVGMVRADTDVDDYPAWDFATGSLNGTVLKIKTVELIRRGEPVDVRMAVVKETGGDKFTLWESANLGDFFDNITPEMEINISKRGEVALSGSRTMHLFDAFYRP